MDKEKKLFSIASDFENESYLGGVDIEGRLVPLSAPKDSADDDLFERNDPFNQRNQLNNSPVFRPLTSFKNLRELEKQETFNPLSKSSKPFIDQECDFSSLNSIFSDPDLFPQLSASPKPVKGKVYNNFKLDSTDSTSIRSTPTTYESNFNERIMFYSTKFDSVYGNCLSSMSDNNYSIADLINGVKKNLNFEQIAQQKKINSDLIKAADSSSVPQTSINFNSFFWLDITNPTIAELEILSKIFYIHPLTVEDISSPETAHDKVDVFGDYIFITYLAIENDKLEDNASIAQSSPFFILVKNSCILSFHTELNTSYPHGAIKRLHNLTASGNHHYLTTSYITYALIDLITDDIGPIARHIEIEVDSIDELVLLLSKREHNDMLLKLGTARRRILSLFRISQGKPNTIKALVRELNKKIHYFEDRFIDLAGKLNSKNDDSDPSIKSPYINNTPNNNLDNNTNSERERTQNSNTAIPIPSTQESLKFPSEIQFLKNNIHSFKEVVWSYSDVSDHINYLLTVCSQSELILARTHSNHMGKISIDLAKTSEGISKLANNLAIIGVISMPFVILGGLFGMNVRVPGQDREDLAWFFGIVGVCLGFIFVAVYIYIRGLKRF
ncbi:Magnesium transporter ALR2 [Smittium culicis]|uniref:Magnesium transporter ALR2 n=1 Tax=Smittium culicis TaxID=133412 RepID=A0A1R1Y1M3_9FUNG|nr:Magnesium transporter ALR2 [Smittium culicis]